ncbi:Glutaminyl-peptide cyclotransferase [Gracilariopsis chorda]|uniref:Glutaminyl-peptide cyclotransferase n=1 Tax=Gracilariopsis chorda TaxID=448386 RepID=A0A2V3IF12_9FLOR|nr:Glutaminyl-peptide cyclotransferase [Gracilariopsis chorda]|eukprot:PXF40657.1 Glutaminyl-peptide cyclotransferase [Gracilariopsis chorda]
MSSTATYEIADTDELEALGCDDPTYDTSAALGHNESVHTPMHTPVYHPSEPRWKHRWCLPVVLVVLAFTATSAFVGIFLSIRKGDIRSNDASGSESTTPISPVAAPDTTANPNSTQDLSPTTPLRHYTVEVVTKHPHDPYAFTQGFEYANGFFYESTGIQGRSSLRKVEIATGKVLQNHSFSDLPVFGEGMTLHTTHHIFMLTWKAGRGFIFNQSTFELQKEWKYEGEGWGLAMDRKNNEVYMSDGTSELRILDPEDLSERRRIQVTLEGQPVTQLNELEWICDELWSNVWQTSKIYRINPMTGVVKSVIDASNLPLREDVTQRIDVLNGIAFDEQTGRLWLTGKLWPSVYQVSVKDDDLDLAKCK